MLAVFKKELKSQFTSMIGFVFIAFFLLLEGLFFVMYNLYNQLADFSYSLSGIGFLFVLLVPILTMRSLAEEKHQKTDQLLYTSPISIGKIIMGKYFAMVALFGIAMLIVCIYPLILSAFGTIDFAIAYGSIFGFFLMGSTYIAIGLLISSLTESQVIAAVISFVVMLFSYLMSSLGSILPTEGMQVYFIMAVIVLLTAYLFNKMVHNVYVTTLIYILIEVGMYLIYRFTSVYDSLFVNIFSWLSISDRYADFNQGIFSIKSIIYYISLSFIFVFATAQRIRKKRWSE